MSMHILNRAGARLAAAFRKTVSWATATVFVLSTSVPQLGVSTAHAAPANNYVRISAENATVPKRIKIGLDKSMVVDLPADAHDILVANPVVADAVTRTARRIYLFGKQVGLTNVFVFDGRGNQIAAMEITIERDINGLEDMLSRLIPNSDIRAEMMNDNIVLTGSVVSPSDSAKAVDLAKIFVKGGEATAPRATQAAGVDSLFTAERTSEIVNLLKIQGEDQVHLKVMIVEVQRAIVKQLGIATQTNNPGSDGFGFRTLAAGAMQQTVGNSAGGTFGIGQGLNSIASQLQALESTGVMRMLAEPSLTAISGETAHFKAGGQYFVPSEVEKQVEAGDPENGPTSLFGAKALAVTSRAIDYGVSLSFIPTVLSEGRISLKLSTEVQEPTAMGASTLIREVNMPGVRNRQASTTVELPSGGSMVIAGLLMDDVRQVVSGFPGLKNIPIFGTLFRSREYVRNESEVLIVVTPYLVRPTALKNIVRPDKNFQPASDAAGMFMGRVNRVYGTRQGDLPAGRYTGSIGFILK